MRLGKNTAQAASVQAKRVRVAACIPSKKCEAFLRERVEVLDTLNAPGCQKASGGALCLDF